MKNTGQKKIMSKFKLTRGELKQQRDGLQKYERYLPTLQLKKQQLQIEILSQVNAISQRRHLLDKKEELAMQWAGLLSEADVAMTECITVVELRTATKNIAGADIPVFVEAQFGEGEYDLFLVPLWVDHAIEYLRDIIRLRKEIEVIENGLQILRHELRITTQRVNLFEKVKIPEAREAIRVIKIYIGDQMANAVGRSKIAKAKIEKFQEAIA